MLTPELKKLKEHLEGKQSGINKENLLKELIVLDTIELQALFESLSMSSGVCPTCGKKL